MRRLQRRQLLIALGAAYISPVASIAQVRLPTIGLLWNDTVKPSPYRVTLLRALREKGYVVDGNIRIEDRISPEGYGGMSKGAADLASAKVNVIVTYGATATIAAAKATREIPIVMIIGTDPVMLGLVKSLSHPDSNLTGLTSINNELTGKRIQLLKELIPGMSQVGVLFAPGSGSSVNSRREITDAIRVLNLNSHFAEVLKPEDIEGAFATLSKSRVNAVCVHGSTMLAANSERVVALAAKYRLPAIYSVLREVDAGGLIGYASNIHAALTDVARYVDRILKGERPQDLPIEQASQFELVINLKTAKALGLAIPPSMLLRANRVIE